MTEVFGFKLPTKNEIIKALTPLVIFNLFLLFIIIVSGAILFMVIVGMIQFDDPAVKDHWFEVNGQILNACFTITAVMTQPIRFELFLWTVSWYRAGDKATKENYANKVKNEMPDINLHRSIAKPGSISQDIAIISSNTDTTNTSADPGDLVSSSDTDLKSKGRTSLSSSEFTPTWKWCLILFYLNFQCIFQYPITVVQWMYIGIPEQRPDWVIGVFLPLSFLCGALGGIWPLLL